MDRVLEISRGFFDLFGGTLGCTRRGGASDLYSSQAYGFLPTFRETQWTYLARALTGFHLMTGSEYMIPHSDFLGGIGGIFLYVGSTDWIR